MAMGILPIVLLVVVVFCLLRVEDRLVELTKLLKERLPDD